MKKQSIGKHSSVVEDHFDLLCLEFGAWFPNYEGGQNSLFNLARR